MSRKQPIPRRILKETARVKKCPPHGISIIPEANNFRHFFVTIAGPAGTAYAGGMFKLEMYLPEEYPMVPPKVHFLTRVYHPNIDRVGRICLDILKNKWSPALQMDKICLSIQLLLQFPNPDDPLDNNIAQVMKTDNKKFLKKAAEWTRLYAGRR